MSPVTKFLLIHFRFVLILFFNLKIGGKGMKNLLYSLAEKKLLMIVSEQKNTV